MAGAGTTGPTVIVIDDDKPQKIPSFNGKQRSFQNWWDDVQRILPNTKWAPLYDTTTYMVVS
eukprot:8909155-Ditylum_brightwellii.AAC.1